MGVFGCQKQCAELVIDVIVLSSSRFGCFWVPEAACRACHRCHRFVIAGVWVLLGARGSLPSLSSMSSFCHRLGAPSLSSLSSFCHRRGVLLGARARRACSPTLWMGSPRRATQILDATTASALLLNQQGPRQAVVPRKTLRRTKSSGTWNWAAFAHFFGQEVSGDEAVTNGDKLGGMEFACFSRLKTESRAK